MGLLWEFTTIFHSITLVRRISITICFRMHSCLPPCVRTYIHNAAYDTQTVSWSLRCTDSRVVSSGTVEAAKVCPERFQVIRDHPGTEARRDLAPV